MGIDDTVGCCRWTGIWFATGTGWFVVWVFGEVDPGAKMRGQSTELWPAVDLHMLDEFAAAVAAL